MYNDIEAFKNPSFLFGSSLSFPYEDEFARADYLDWEGGTMSDR